MLDIQVETMLAIITIVDNVSRCTRRVPLKWVLGQQEYESLLVGIRSGLVDLIEEFDMLDKLSVGFDETSDG